MKQWKASAIDVISATNITNSDLEALFIALRYYKFAMLYLGNGVRYSLGDNQLQIGSHIFAFDCNKSR